MNQYFRVGILTNPKPDDRTFVDFDAAYRHGYDLSAKDNLTPFAVWNDDDEVVLLFLYGHEFVEQK